MEPSRCINNIAFYIGQAVGNIIIDLLLFSLPILMISRLQISFSQKIAVMGIFLLGAFVTLTSALRLWQLILTQKHDTPDDFDPTWNLVGAAVWSTVECNLSIVCACLPSMRPLLRLLLHGTLRSGDGYGSGYASGARSHRRGAATPGKYGSGMWDRGVPQSWSGSRPGSKRNSMMRVMNRDIRTDERGVRVDDYGFRVSTGDVPLVGSRTRSKSMKAYVEANTVELETAPTRPRPMPRAVTSPVVSPGRAPVKNWFDAGNERVSESSDEVSLTKHATRIESNTSRSVNPVSRRDQPRPLMVNGNRRGIAAGENHRALTLADPWGLEIEKTTDVIVSEDRR